MLKIGDIAICKHKNTGLITKILDTPKGRLYKGVNISDKFGKAWQSRDPKLVANINDLLNRVDFDQKAKREILQTLVAHN